MLHLCILSALYDVSVLRQVRQYYYYYYYYYFKFDRNLEMFLI